MRSESAPEVRSGRCPGTAGSRYLPNSQVIYMDLVHVAGDTCGMLVVDATGFVNRRTGSAGPIGYTPEARAGSKIVRSGSSSGYATPAGRMFLGRELYPPKGWADGRDRGRDEGIDDEVAFTTEPVLAMRIMAGALRCGRWPAGSAETRCMRQHTGLRRMLEKR